MLGPIIHRRQMNVRLTVIEMPSDAAAAAASATDTVMSRTCIGRMQALHTYTGRVSSAVSLMFYRPKLSARVSSVPMATNGTGKASDGLGRCRKVWPTTQSAILLSIPLCFTSSVSTQLLPTERVSNFIELIVQFSFE